MAFVTGTHRKSRFRTRSARYGLPASRPGDRPFLANSPNATRIARTDLDDFGTVQLLFTNGVEFLNCQVVTSSRHSAISHGQVTTRHRKGCDRSKTDGRVLSE